VPARRGSRLSMRRRSGSSRTAPPATRSPGARVKRASSPAISSRSCRRRWRGSRRRGGRRRHGGGATVPAIEVVSTSPEETEALGAALGRAARGGELLRPIGQPGARQDCFGPRLAGGLGIHPAHVPSPSFPIATEYRGGRLPLTHVDLYRLERPHDEEPLLRDALYGAGVAAVEWFDRLAIAPDDEVLLITLRFTTGEGRAIRLDPRGERRRVLLARAGLP